MVTQLRFGGSPDNFSPHKTEIVKNFLLQRAVFEVLASYHRPLGTIPLALLFQFAIQEACGDSRYVPVELSPERMTYPVGRFRHLNALQIQKVWDIANNLLGLFSINVESDALMDGIFDRANWVVEHWMSIPFSEMLNQGQTVYPKPSSSYNADRESQDEDGLVMLEEQEGA